MQFTIIIEFLIPGLATILLGLALFAGETASTPYKLPQIGETATALLLLAVSYPVGHLVNFPVFVCLQRSLLGPLARRRVLEAYRRRAVHLHKIAREDFYFQARQNLSWTNSEIRDLFGFMRTLVFSRNFVLFSSSYLHYQGLQRLSRGMVIPLLMAVLLVCEEGGTFKFWLLIALGASLAMFVSLLYHALYKEEERVADFFALLAAEKRSQQPAANETSNPGT